MAKIKGPLFSADATGNFAKGAMQFRGGLRGTHAYRPKSPKTVNQAPPTQKQTEVRNAYRTILDEWKSLDEATKAEWDVDAIRTEEPITGWNLYFRSRLPAVLNGSELPDPDTYTPPAATEITFPGTTWVTDTSYTIPIHTAIIF